jgi:hypothetical protein
MTQERCGETSAAPSEKTIARLKLLGCVSTPMGTGKSYRPWCARSQVRFTVRVQLQRNSRMMERSRLRRRQRNANEALQRLQNTPRVHAGASMTIMRCVGGRVSPDSTAPALGLGNLNFGASNNKADPSSLGRPPVSSGSPCSSLASIGHGRRRSCPCDGRIVLGTRSVAQLVQSSQIGQSARMRQSTDSLTAPARSGECQPLRAG